MSDLIGAHALQFERPSRGPYPAAAGARLLMAFVLVGLVLQPTLRLARRAGLAQEQHWAGPAIVVALVLAVALAMRGFVRLDGGTIGLHRWKAWTPRERIYVCTVVPIAATAFAFVFREHIARLVVIHGWAGLLALSVPTALLWGMVQEVLYRGLLQTELVRRLGGVAGVLLANLAFTFGPLHANYFGIGTDGAPRWGMFAAIFAIGLYFGILYRRSGNLWIPALLHGIWPPNMT